MHDVQKTPRLRIDLDGQVPLARQIADGLRALLVAGDIRAGDRLPSSRRLGVDLGVHFNTVAEAYRELEREGWLALRRKQGTFVRQRPPRAPGSAERARLLDAFRDECRLLLARYRAQGLETGALLELLKKELSDV